MLAALRIYTTQPIAHAILVLSVVAVVGLAVGSIKYRGIALGSAGVLFAGIVVGHFGATINHEILDFVKEFGLVLFVFTIGLQLGPGFVAALREQGLMLNLLAIAIVVLGAATAMSAAKILHAGDTAVPGVFAGATTNTPSLGATQQAIAAMPDISSDAAALPALAYAVSYPIGIAGILGSMLALKAIYRIDPAKEAQQAEDERRGRVERVEAQDVLIENRRLDGLALAAVPGRADTGVVVSRIRDSATTNIRPASDTTILHVGDVLHAVGTRAGLDQFTRIVGRVSDVDLMKLPGRVTYQRIAVTRTAVLGETIRSLALDHLYGVTVTRVIRGDLEMTATPELPLRFGDVCVVVGEPDAIAQAAGALGNALKELNETQFIPLFLGIVLGVIAGIIPISLPGLPVPMRLGLAGGPLILGIVLSRLGHVGRVVWHMPKVVNLAFRELGITLFLAAVGLKAGEKFFATVFSNTGLIWLVCALLTATVPLLVVGAAARSALKLNFTTISGLIAGSTTDPPALAFAGLLARSEGPYVAYATVYPLTMLLRILSAQAMVLILCR
jgi:putative transport protein